jgi:hypothetical protein
MAIDLQADWSISSIVFNKNGTANVSLELVTTLPKGAVKVLDYYGQSFDKATVDAVLDVPSGDKTIRQALIDNIYAQLNLPA